MRSGGGMGLTRDAGGELKAAGGDEGFGLNPVENAAAIGAGAPTVARADGAALAGVHAGTPLWSCPHEVGAGARLAVGGDE